MNKKLYILWCSVMVFLYWGVSLAAKPWNLTGIQIIPRSSWIENESIIFKKPATSGTIVSDQEDESTSISIDKGVIINNYLRQVFPEQFILDEIIKTINGKDLHRSRGYKNNKTHIVIHHTVSDMKKITTPLEALTTINAIFKFHTQTRKRWDIWYNFIIDPWGNIYEGRGWGENIIGAHAAYNNAPSLGIALMGNFEIDEPTQAQLDALTKLATAITIKYRINPDNEVYSHIADDQHPYINDKINTAIMGHKDTGKTACPGTNLYNKIPSIRSAIKKELKSKNLLFPLRPIRYTYNHTTSFFASKDTTNIRIPYPLNSTLKSCTITDKNLRARSCKSDGKTISFILTKKKNTVWPETILFDFTTRNNVLYRIAFKVDRASDQIIKLIKRKTEYIAKKWAPKPWVASEKIKVKITKDDIKELIKKPVNVLLYELSTNQKEWKFLCPNCTITDDQWNMYTDKSFTINDDSTSLSYISKTNTKTNINKLIITTNKSDSKIFVTNYGRKSYAGIARNNFYGTITISRQDIKNLDTNTISEEFGLVNTLPLNLYMRGIIESNDKEPTEKVRTMSLLAKNYTIYYLSPWHRHPSIPEGVNYNAIDDARSFQKYVWAGVDNTLITWRPALELTANQFVMYKWNLAFLPYFTCSAGFTWSAKEKRWWTDTPYLQSVFDPDYCTEFQWHGVGLAGNWATALANKWMKYKEIINYYYSGTTLETL